MARRDLESSGLEALVPDAQAVPLPGQDLHAVAAAVHKQEQAPVERIGRQLLADDAAQSVEALPHIGRPRVDVDRHRRRDAQHPAPPSSQAGPERTSSRTITRTAW